MGDYLSNEPVHGVPTHSDGSRTDETIRVFVADGHDLVIGGISAAISTQSDMEVCGTVRSGLTLFEQVRDCRPDVILLDINLPHFTLYEELHNLLSLRFNPHLIVVTALCDSATVQGILAAGASGYLVKEDSLSHDLADSIREACRGQLVLSQRIRGLIDQGEPENGKRQYKLSVEQEWCLTLMVNGLSNAEIMERMDKSKGALGMLQHRIRVKLGVEKNWQAVAKAIRLRLVPFDLGSVR